MIATSPPACPVHVVGKRIESPSGRVVYRDPTTGTFVPSHQYVLVRSADGGRSFRIISSEHYFGVNAPHEFDSYAGPWTIVGPESAYFAGWCPACGRGSVSLWVTHDGGRTFRSYAVPALLGFGSTLASVRVTGADVTITTRSRTATVTVR